MQSRHDLTTYRSRVYRRLLNVVAAEAASNERFLDNLKAAVRDGERALLMYFQMRTRLEAIMLRFDRDPRKNDAINTATRLRSLIKAIGSIIQSDNLKAMDPMTKNQYFGLLLDLLRGVVDRDRPRDSQGSRSPYVTESGRDVSLYQQLKETQEKKHGVMYAAALLGFMFSKLSPHGPDARQMEHVGSMLRAVENRHGLSGIAVFPNSPDPTQALAAQLRKIQAGKPCEEITSDYADLVVHSNQNADSCQLTLIAILLRSDSILDHCNTIPLTDISYVRCCAGRSTFNRLLLSRDVRSQVVPYLDFH